MTTQKEKQIARVVAQVLKAQQPKRATSAKKSNPKKALTAFMAKQGYKPTAEKVSKYTTKAGVEKEAKIITFSNGCNYIVGESRFWKQ